LFSDSELLLFLSILLFFKYELVLLTLLLLFFFLNNCSFTSFFLFKIAVLFDSFFEGIFLFFSIPILPDLFNLYNDEPFDLVIFSNEELLFFLISE